MGEHAIRLHEVRRMGGRTWFRATCSCGYQSGLRAFPGRAESAAEDHKRAKEDTDDR